MTKCEIYFRKFTFKIFKIHDYLRASQGLLYFFCLINCVVVLVLEGYVKICTSSLSSEEMHKQTGMHISNKKKEKNEKDERNTSDKHQFSDSSPTPHPKTFSLPPHCAFISACIHTHKNI